MALGDRTRQFADGCETGRRRLPIQDAEFAGARALKDFLVALAAEQIREMREQRYQTALQMCLRYQAS